MGVSRAPTFLQLSPAFTHTRAHVYPHRRNQGIFLTDALRNYGKALAASRGADLRAVFAVVSLWFNNQANPAVNEEMEEIIRTVSCRPLFFGICCFVAAVSAGGGA